MIFFCIVRFFNETYTRQRFNNEINMIFWFMNHKASDQGLKISGKSLNNYPNFLIASD